jgi:hypothetical protein
MPGLRRGARNPNDRFGRWIVYVNSGSFEICEMKSNTSTLAWQLGKLVALYAHVILGEINYSPEKPTNTHS